MESGRLRELKAQIAQRASQVSVRAGLLGERARDLMRHDLAALDRESTALTEQVEIERRQRHVQAVADAKSRTRQARDAVAALIGRLAPGPAGASPHRLAEAPALSTPSRWTRVGSLSAPEDLRGAPALMPLTCSVHWRVEGSTRQAQELVVSTLARLVAQVPLPHLRLLVFDPRVTGVLGGLAPLRDASGAAFPPPSSDPDAFADAVRAAMTQAVSNAERIAVAGARDLIDLWDDEGEASGVLTVVVVLDHPYGGNERLDDVLARLAAMSPANGIHLVIQHDPAYGQTPHGLGTLTPLVYESGTWTVPGIPEGAVVAHEEALPREALDAVVRSAKDRATSSQGPTIPLADLVGSDIDSPWSASSLDSLDATIGRAGREPLTISLRSENPPHPNLLVGGAVGQGKSNLLLDIIYSLAARYSPDEMSLALLDYKRGLEFHRFAPDAQGANWLPHAKVLSLESDQEFGVAVLRHVAQEMAQRSDLFKEAGTPSIGAYRRQTGRAMPRLLLIVDEFHEILEGDDDLAEEAASLLTHIAKQGRAYGVHLLLSSQTISGISGLRAKGDAIFAQFPLRMSLKNTAQESEAILAQHNRAASELTYRGEVIVNRNSGQDPQGSNIRAMAAWADPEVLDGLQARLFELDHDEPPMVFISTQNASWPPHGPQIDEEADGPTMWLGRPVSVTPAPVALTLDSDTDQGIILVGSGDDLADCALSSMTLTGLRTMEEDCELMVLNGMKQLPPGLARVVDAQREHGRVVRVVDREQVPEVLVRDIAPLLEDGHDHPMLVVGVGLQRVNGMDQFPDVAPPTTTFAEDFHGEGESDAGGIDDSLSALFTPAPTTSTPAQLLQRVFERGGLQKIFAMGWWSSRRAMERDVGSFALPGVRVRVLFKLPLDDLRDLAGPHTKPFGSGPRIGVLDHADDAGLRVVVPFETPKDQILEEAW